MNKLTDKDVIINGKQCTISGYESSEYMHKVASYLNDKYTEFKKQPSYQQLDNEMRNILLQLNIADDYFKLKEQMRDRENDSDLKSNEIFELKHEVISLQTKLNTMSKELEKEKRERFEQEKRNVRLETELENLQRMGARLGIPEAVKSNHIQNNINHNSEKKDFEEQKNSGNKSQENSKKADGQLKGTV